MLVKCPKCRTENPDTQKFCGECGAPLPYAEEISISSTMTIQVPIQELSPSVIFAGRYQVLKELGKGGMGRVYKVMDTQINEEIALKLLKPEIASDEGIIERFRNELKIARKITHKYVCRMHDINEEEGTPYITMEYVGGEDLKSLVRRRRSLTQEDAIRIAKQVCEGLAEAHDLGVVHRDLKPQNIMIDKLGNIKIMDFGIARSIEAPGVTKTGMIIGTPDYISPEQAEGEEVDRRSDIYSLGVILYELITGRMPFSGDTALSIALKHKTQLPLDPRKLNPEVSEVLSRLILICLEKDKSRRYQTAEALLADLKNIEEGLPLGTKLRPKRKAFEKIRYFFRRWTWAVAAVIIFAILAVGLWLLTRRSQPVLEMSVQQPISIIISDFQNLAGDSDFDESLEELLRIGLEGASFISVYDRPEARKLANQIDPSSYGKINTEMAKMISTREGINYIVDGSVDKVEDGFVIAVRAIDPVKNEERTTASRKIKRKDEVLKVAEYLSSKLRRDLGEIQPESAKVFAQETFTSSSLVALNAYAQGQELQHTKREEAVDWYLKAIDNDPNLGRAYAGLGHVYYSLQQHDLSEKYFQMALARLDGMSEREKYRTLGGYYTLKRNYPKAIEVLSTLVEKFPADTSGHTNLALTYFFSADMAKAAEVGRRAVQINPNESLPRYNLVWYDMGAGDFDAAEKEAHELIARDSEYWEVYVCKALIELAHGFPDQAAETYKNLGVQNNYCSSLAASGLADLALYEGRLIDAETILTNGIAFDMENGQEFIAADKFIALAQLYLLQGKKSLANKAADSALATFKREDVMFSAAEIYTQTGKQYIARNLATELNMKIEPAYRTYAKMIGGLLSLARKDINGAIDLFLEAQGITDIWLCHFFLGQAYLEAEAYLEAYSEFDNCLRRRGEATSVFFNDLPTYHFVPPIYYYLGQAQEGLKSPATTESYEKFVEIKMNADPGIAEVENARKKLAGLKSQ